MSFDMTGPILLGVATAAAASISHVQQSPTKKANRWGSQDHDVLKSAALPFLKKHIKAWSGVNKLEDFELKPLSGGFTNRNFVCVKLNQKPDEQFTTVILRIFGEGTDFFFSRKDEIAVFDSLSKLGFGPRVLGLSQHARIEEFIEARTLRAADLRVPEVSQAIAQTLRHFHALPVRTTSSSQLGADVTLFDSLIRFHAAASNLLAERDDVRTRFDALGPITYYMGILEKDVNRLPMAVIPSERVFSHNDLQYGNIMERSSESGSNFLFIDYEYGSYNPRAYDIGNHFTEWTCDYHGDEPHVLRYEKYPTLEEQRRFVSAYLGDDATDAAVDQLCREARQYSLLADLFWGLWGIIQSSQSSIDWDYVAYAFQRIRHYCDNREHIFPSSSYCCGGLSF